MKITINTPEQLKSALPNGALVEIHKSINKERKEKGEKPIHYNTVLNFRNKEVIEKAKEILKREQNKTI